MADSGTVARLVARTLERRHLTRAGMTRIGALVAIGAAVWFSRADTVGGLVGSALLGVVLFCDAVRGHMRADRHDALTLWLAQMLAHLREYAVHLGLAVGAVLAGINGAWGWAAGALVALALRDSLLEAGNAPAASVAGRGGKWSPVFREHAGGLRGTPGSRSSHASRRSDPVLAARLFGATVITDAGTTSSPDTPEPRTEGGGRSPVPEATTPAGRRRCVGSPLRSLLAFPQPVRFTVVAVAATLWDARVAFVTLVFGCAVAITAHLVDPADHGADR